MTTTDIQPRTPRYKLVFAALPSYSTSVVTTLMGNLINPMFSTLKVGDWIKPFIWMIGPFFGLWQPFFGFWNDQSTFRWGRRRPVLVLGMLMMCVAYTLFWLVSNLILSSRPLNIALGIVGAVFGHGSVPILQPAMRALMSDLCQVSELPRGSSFVSFFFSLGNLTCFLIVCFLPQPFLFGIGMALVVVIPGLIFTKEKRFVPEEEQPNPSIQAVTPPLLDEKHEDGTDESDPLLSQPQPTQIVRRKQNKFIQVIKLFLQVWKDRGPVLGACIATYFSWAGLFPTFPIRLSFVAEVFYKATPGTELYKHGIKIASYGMMGNTVVAIVFSLFVPQLLRCLKPSLFFALCHGLACIGAFILFILPPSFLTPNTIWIFICVYVILLATVVPAVNTVPFVIVDTNTNPAYRALYAGVLNFFSILGQATGLLLNVLIEWLATFDTGFRFHTQYIWLLASVGYAGVVCMSGLLRTKPKKNLRT
ncbi:Glycoside-Pentoside-Hexuronide:Cation Symporter (MFS) [Blattamonas nauphoetae]|uniref:Glycoside-Pentoside-Hexuronide:Cation Symporter (MFS) n=1 Tax=Blattamonas nauphoetae TaxID=2049346 RepID=A0ABQ9XZ45_9EUKA|nr:Glycoside-Pentoside-Hexuronide:Cation Symporter (MFS) [Blattamonas nauphoetae]